jgi:hypothetical protein
LGGALARKDSSSAWRGGRLSPPASPRSEWRRRMGGRACVCSSIGFEENTGENSECAWIVDE